MADDILDHEARACQSQENTFEAESENSSLMRIFGTVFESSTFSLTFNASQWHLFWRLLNVGCMLSDQMQEYAKQRIRITDTSTALLWNELSTEFAALLSLKEVISVKRQRDKSTND